MGYLRYPNTNCQVCNKPIYRKPSEIKKSHGHAFCSMDCYGKSIRKERPCLVCGTPIMAQFNKKTCSRACANKHRAGTKYLGRRPKDKVVHFKSLKLRLLRNRVNQCAKCGYNKIEILQIHHKDRNRKNNNLENLELICPNCHFEEHLLEKSWLKGYNLQH